MDTNKAQRLIKTAAIAINQVGFILERILFIICFLNNFFGLNLTRYSQAVQRYKNEEIFIENV